MRIGHGFDAHRLVEGRPFVLGGIEIPFERGPLGHSDADVLAHAISDALLGACALAAAAAANPFAMRRGVDPKALYVTFLIRPSGRRSLAGVELPVRPGEEAVLKRDAVYVYCPHGYGDTRLNNAFFERRLACAATTRNWRTVNALLEMSAP